MLPPSAARDAVARYEPRRLTVGTLGSHSALDVVLDSFGALMMLMVLRARHEPGAPAGAAPAATAYEPGG